MNPTQNPYRITQKDRPPVGQGAVTGPAPDGSGAGGASSLNQLNDAEDVRAIEALSTTGLLARTAAATWALRTLIAPAAGLTIADGDGVGGDPTFALANDLAALEGLAGTGWAKRTADDTWSVSASIPAPEVSYDHTVSGLTATDVKAAIDELAAMSAGLADGDYGDVTVSGSGTMMTVDNVAWANVSGRPTTLAGYGISDAQPADADLTAIAALTTTAFGRSVLTQADGSAVRTLLGLATTDTPQFARLGIGAPADSAIPLYIPGNQFLSSARFGAFEVQSYAVNNCWLCDNIYYDGFVFRYRANGYGAMSYFQLGGYAVETAASGIAGAAATMTTRLFVANDGSVGLGGAMSYGAGTSGASAALDTSGNLSLVGSVKTGAPSGGTAQPWKFGSYVAGAVAATGIAQIEIAGTAYKVLVST